MKDISRYHEHLTHGIRRYVAKPAWSELGVMHQGDNEDFVPTEGSSNCMVSSVSIRVKLSWKRKNIKKNQNNTKSSCKLLRCEVLHNMSQLEESLHGRFLPRYLIASLAASLCPTWTQCPSRHKEQIDHLWSISISLSIYKYIGCPVGDSYLPSLSTLLLKGHRLTDISFIGRACKEAVDWSSNTLCDNDDDDEIWPVHLSTYLQIPLQERSPMARVILDYEIILHTYPLWRGIRLHGARTNAPWLPQVFCYAGPKATLGSSLEQDTIMTGSNPPKKQSSQWLLSSRVQGASQTVPGPSGFWNHVSGWIIIFDPPKKNRQNFKTLK